MNIHSSIRELIIEGKIQEALEKLTAYLQDIQSNSFDEAVILNGRWNELRSMEVKGTVDTEQASLMKNQVADSILYLLRLEQESQKSDGEIQVLIQRSKRNRIWSIVFLGLNLLISGVLVWKNVQYSESEKEIINTIAEHGRPSEALYILRGISQKDLVHNKKALEKALRQLESRQIDDFAEDAYFIQGVKQFDLAKASKDYDSITNAYQEAIYHLKLALDREPENKDAIRHLGWSYHNLGEIMNLNSYYEKAIRQYLRYIELDPTFPHIYLDISQTYINQGDEVIAYEYFLQAQQVGNLDSVTLADWQQYFDERQASEMKTQVQPSDSHDSANYPPQICPPLRNSLMVIP
ncbi:hypothetical protein [Pontibacter sp. G13]|uniref:hypothetical protein n=1 Tax=Pontibacter sp. G13 TaxID=3074898 RepID=UPI00288C377E|nr:hypothetical protein [Pontibacter sp. G13]WNJ19349.1 hypothetical protein RJD25_02555 [Pontibacter sp. G13]